MLFKDEVRKIGLALGIDSRLIGRHPFPGPGLAIRIIGEVTREKLETLREADAIFIDSLRNYGDSHSRRPFADGVYVYIPCAQAARSDGIYRI